MGTVGAAVIGAVVGAGPATAVTPGQSASSTPMCGTSQLDVRLGGGDAGAGNLYRYLVFTNRSGTTCHLTGFPGVSLLDSDGRQIGAPATREHNGYTPVVLRPGGTASDTIHTVNHQGTCLPTSTSVRVYPPGNRASVVVPGEITNCHDQFSVTPLTAGSAGNPADRAPLPTPTAVPSPQPGQQVPVVPSGAPDTGLGATSRASDGQGGTTAVAAGAAGGALALGGLGLVLRRRRTSAARARG